MKSSYLFRHYRYEQKLACLLWKIELKDVEMFEPFPSGLDGKNSVRVGQIGVLALE